jgi:CheY-like chemotaxis protein
MGNKLCPRILIVDDNRVTLLFLDELLSGEYEVVAKQDPAEALDYVYSDSVDLVVSDYKMPKMNGVELFHEIKQIHRNVPFIIISAEDNDDNVRRAKEAGVDSYMSKPLNIGAFLNTVKSTLNLNN